METVGGSTAPKTLVVDGVNADLLTVVAQAGGELGFFTVDGNAPGVSRTR